MEEVEDNGRVNRIIRTYLLLAGLYTLSASLIWGVNTLFLLAAGLNIFQVFVVNSIFTGSMALFEIPTGVLADTRGRRTSFLLSLVVLLAGTLGYVEASTVESNLWLFALASVVLGLGFTFYSGAMEAWLVDALEDAGYSGKLDQIFARSAFVSGAAMLIGSIGGGALGGFDLALPFLARAGLLALVFGVAFFQMHDQGFAPRPVHLAELPAEMRKIARSSITFGWQNPSIRLLILASLIQSVFLAWGFYAWQPHFLALLGQDAAWVAGVIAALIALATMAGNSIVAWVTRFCGKRTTLLLWAAGVQTAAAIGVGLATSFWIAVPLFLVVMGTTGVWGPVRQAYMHQMIPSHQRATVVSFDSLVASSGSVAGQTGLGRLAQVRSIGAGYVVGGLTTILVLPMVFWLRRRSDPADVIIGEAGKQGACAASGLPSISSVDTAAVVADA